MPTASSTKQNQSSVVIPTDQSVTPEPTDVLAEARLTDQASLEAPTLPHDAASDPVPSPVEGPSLPMTRSGRVSRPPKFLEDFVVK